jgi:hypothetical protein
MNVLPTVSLPSSLHQIPEGKITHTLYSLIQGQKFAQAIQILGQETATSSGIGIPGESYDTAKAAGAGNAIRFRESFASGRGDVTRVNYSEITRKNRASLSLCGYCYWQLGDFVGAARK